MTGLAWRKLTRTLQHVSLHPTLGRLRNRVRVWRDDHVHWPLVQLWRAHLLLSSRESVLALGESSYLFVSPADNDKRKLPAMVRDVLDDDLSIVTLCGPGYDPRLYCEFVRLLTNARRRPRVVLLALCLRSSMSTHVQLNPRFGYSHAREVMCQLTSPRPPLSSLFARGGAAPNEHGFEDALVETRWDQPRTMGEFRKLLRGSATARDRQVERMLFNYFHGEIVAADSPGLQKWAELGRLLRDFGVPVVAYHTPLPLKRGEQHYPGEFIDHVRTNERWVETSLARELGDLLHLVALPALDDADFIDVGDATEHFAQSGRHKISTILGAAVNEVLHKLP